MGLIVVDEGALRACDLFARKWPTARRIGLYQNQVLLSRHTTIDTLEPAEFSGYDGERPLPDFAPPQMNGDRAIAYADPVTWSYDGGDPTGYVVGYYVVDDDGYLLWVEQRAAGPLAMVSQGQVYTVTPALSTATRYGGTT